MSARSMLGVLAKGAAFRATGSLRLGRGLTDAFLDGGESARTAAGILLVRAGNRSLPAVSEALAEPRGTDLVDVLASIDTTEALSELRRIAADARHPAASRAAEALARRGRDAGIGAEQREE